MNLGLTGKVAIVMAASKGLGKASALTLAQEGAKVVICARDKEILEAAAQEIKDKSNSEVLAIPADVLNPDDLRQVVEKTVEKLGKIDILVNNAGGPPPGTFDRVTDDQWKQAFELNLMSAIRLIRLALPYIKKTGSGRIINMVSISAKQPVDNLILSNSIRAGVVGMAKTLSNELAADAITVNNILTGHFLTDRLKKLYHIEEKLKQGMSDKEAWQEVISNTPMKRLGKPEEFGSLVAFLASEQAAFITGTSIQIDGGLIRSLL